MRTRLVVALFLVALGRPAQAQFLRQVELPDVMQLTRVELGWTQLTIGGVSGVSERKARGAELRLELRLLSYVLGERTGWTASDALYTDLALGGLVSSQLRAGDRVEESFSVLTTGGYQLVVGRREADWGLLGGIRLEWIDAMLGGSRLPSEHAPSLLHVPIVARGELQLTTELRAIASAWAGVIGPGQSFGGALEVPFGKTVWVTVRYEQVHGQVAMWSQPVQAGHASMFAIGLKAGRFD